MNIWFGPQERQYVQAMHRFADHLDVDVQMRRVNVSQPAAVRAWALSSSNTAAAYLHHYADHTNAVTNLTITG